MTQVDIECFGLHVDPVFHLLSVVSLGAILFFSLGVTGISVWRHTYAWPFSFPLLTFVFL